MKRSILAITLALSTCSGFQPAYAGVDGISVVFECEGKSNVMTITKHGNMFMDGDGEIVIPNSPVGSTLKQIDGGITLAVVGDGYRTVGITFKAGRSMVLLNDDGNAKVCVMRKFLTGVNK